MHTSLPFTLSVEISARIAPTGHTTHTPEIYYLGRWDVHQQKIRKTATLLEATVPHITSLDDAITHIMDTFVDEQHPLYNIPRSSIEYTIFPKELTITSPWHRSIDLPIATSTPWSCHPDISDILISTYDSIATDPYIRTHMRGIIINPSRLDATLFHHIPFPYMPTKRPNRHVTVWNKDFTGFIRLVKLPVDINDDLMILINETPVHDIHRDKKIVCIHTKDYTLGRDVHNRQRWGNNHPILGECPWPCTPHDIATMLIDMHQYLPPSSHHTRINWVRQWRRDPSTNPTIQTIMTEANTYCNTITAWQKLPVIMPIDHT